MSDIYNNYVVKNQSFRTFGYRYIQELTKLVLYNIENDVSIYNITI